MVFQEDDSQVWHWVGVARGSEGRFLWAVNWSPTCVTSSLTDFKHSDSVPGGSEFQMHVLTGKVGLCGFL